MASGEKRVGACASWIVSKKVQVVIIESSFVYILSFGCDASFSTSNTAEHFRTVCLMLNSDKNAEECDATNDDSSNSAGSPQKIRNRKLTGQCSGSVNLKSEIENLKLKHGLR